MNWVLIVWLIHGSPIAITNVPFDTKELCQAAFTRMAEVNRSYGVVLVGVCVKQSENAE